MDLGFDLERAMLALEVRALQLDAVEQRPDDAPAKFVPFGDWLADARWDLDFTDWHFREMQKRLDRVTLGSLQALVFEVAVRHGKTEHNTIGYGAYRLEDDPATRILLGTYNQRQARKLSRQIRRLAQARGVDVVSTGDDEWETAEGGGVRALGAGAGSASVNADLIIVDDPIGSREDAESQAVRDRTWDWLTSDIWARAEEHTQFLFSMPRWHKDDPMGRIRDQQSEQWHFVRMKGVAEPDRQDGEDAVQVGDDWRDEWGRRRGELLWPRLRGQEWMDRQRIFLGSYAFASLMQASPRPREGGMFRWSWWKMLDVEPAVGDLVRYWDLAGTDTTGKNDPDYTAGVLALRMDSGATCFVHVDRFRKSVAQRDALMRERCAADLARYGRRVRWWIETEAGISGTERTESLVRSLQAMGMVVHTERPTGSKVLRAEPLASKCEAGNAYLLRGDWNDAFRTEHADFPGGAHDDQVDASSGADVKLATPVKHVRRFRHRV